MRRAYIIWALRQVFSPFMVKIYLGAAFLWELGRQVWVARVLQDAPGLSHAAANPVFFVHAFENTRFPVQALVVALIIIGSLLVRDFVSKLSHLRAGSLAYMGRE